MIPLTQATVPDRDAPASLRGCARQPATLAIVAGAAIGYVLLVLITGRAPALGGMDAEGSAVAAMVTGLTLKGTEAAARLSPLFAMLAWVPYVLTRNVALSLVAVNTGCMAVLALATCLMLDEHGVSRGWQVFAVANLTASIAFAKLTAFAPARPELCAVAFLALAIALTRARHPMVTLVAYFAAVLAHPIGLAAPVYGFARQRRLRAHAAGVGPADAGPHDFNATAVTCAPALLLWLAVQWWGRGGVAGILSDFRPARLFAPALFWTRPVFLLFGGYFFLTAVGGLSVGLMTRVDAWRAASRERGEVLLLLLVLGAYAVLSEADMPWAFGMMAPGWIALLAIWASRGDIPRDRRILAIAVTFAALVTVVTQRPFAHLDLTQYFVDWHPFQVLTGRAPITFWGVRYRWAPRFLTVGGAVALLLVARAYATLGAGGMRAGALVRSARQALRRPAWQRALALIAAVAIAVVAFAYRFNTLGGANAGFDNDEFAHLMRTQALFHGEQPLRDFFDAELRGAWPSLSYVVPAAAQEVWGRNLRAEGFLTAGSLAVAHAILFLLALEISGQWSVSLLAAALAIATTPKLYNYPKVLMLALGLAATRWAMRKPSAARLAVAGAATAVAVLFRHDYGVYVGVGMGAGLLAREAGAWSEAIKRIGIYGAVTAVLLVPGAIWVQVYEGIVPYLANALHSSRIETKRTGLEIPAIDLARPLVETNLIVFTLWAFWATLAVAALVLGWRLLARSGRPTPAERGTAVALMAVATATNVFFLRANLAARFGDAVIPTALLAAWIAGSAPAFTSRVASAVAWTVPRGLLLAMFACAFVYSEVGHELGTARLLGAPADAVAQFHRIAAELERLPPRAWLEDDKRGTMPAARYLAECTSPDDRVVIAAYAPEVAVYAQRLFAGGQPTVSLGFYTSDAEQRRMLERWERQSVPVVLTTYEDFQDQFVTDYPILFKHLSERYREAGAIQVDGRPYFRVFVEADRPVRRTDPRLGLPCFQ